MSELKVLKCPNCGANTTNAENCEFCGSLLVRFVDKGIELSKTSYTNDSITFPGLAAELKRNLQLQKDNPNEPVTTDLITVIDGKYTDCINILRTGRSRWQDDQVMKLSDSKTGLIIITGFETYITGEEEFNKRQDDKLAKFKRLDSFSLFTGHTCSFTDSKGHQRYGREYAIDFGNDAEGAARLISEILQKVQGWTMDTNFDMFTEVGVENILKARKDWEVAHVPSYKRIIDSENVKEKKPWWMTALAWAFAILMWYIIFKFHSCS